MFIEYLEDISIMVQHQWVTCLLMSRSTYFYHLKMLLQTSGISYFRKKVVDLKKKIKETPNPKTNHQQKTRHNPKKKWR